MATASVTPKAVNFVTSLPHKENATRERKAARQMRAKALFTGKAVIKYLGGLSDSDAAELAQGAELQTPAGILSVKNSTAAKCILCGGVHDLTAPNRSILIRWFQKGASVFALSDSCRVDYFDAHAATVLSNPEVYRSAYPKQPTK